MMREPRFPGIDWYCDNCGAHLNTQKNFNDHKYVWKCKECGYKNSISWDNINPDDSKATKFLLYLLGFMGYVSFQTTIMLAIAIFAFHADKNKYLYPFFIFLGVYVFVSIIAIITEFVLRKRIAFNLKNLVAVVLRNLKEDILLPFWYLKEIISNLLSFITHLIPIKRKYIWHSNKTIVAFAVIYLLITTTEIVVFSRIVGLGFNDWRIMIHSVIIWIRQRFN